MVGHGRGAWRVGTRGAWLGGLRIAFWGFAYFTFYFLQQVAELVAPLVLVLGLGWWALPRLVDAVTTHAASADQQTRDILDTIAGTIPTSLQMGGHWITPGGLIAVGLVLMAVAAVAATMSALAGREM